MATPLIKGKKYIVTYDRSEDYKFNPFTTTLEFDSVDWGETQVVLNFVEDDGKPLSIYHDDILLLEELR